MASRYEAAIMLFAPGAGPTNHYAMGERSGTNIDDTGQANLDLTTNGTVTRGAATLLGGDPDGFSINQNKNTVMATRGDNATFDRPSTQTKLTLLTWYKPDDLRTGSTSDVYTLIAKGTATYGLHIAGGNIRFDYGATSPQQLTSKIGDLVRVGVPLFIAGVFDSVAQYQRIYVNGVKVGEQAVASGTTISHSSGGTLQVGGYNAFGANGMHGSQQHVTVFNAHAMAEADIQGLYRVGVVPPTAEGDECMYVFPWSREIVPAGGAYDTIQFRNVGPWPVHLSQGGTAVKGGGITLAPRGGALSKPSRFKGAWSAILDGRYGYSPLAIERVY